MVTKLVDTEEKIKIAARKIFTQKGYAATRTRDIAEEADINLSLLNYYFRSKEKLFNIIMIEKLQEFFGVISPIITDFRLSLEEKVEKIVENYIEMILKNPDLPIFVLSEIRHNPKNFGIKMGVLHLLSNSSLVVQIAEKNSKVDPIHFLLNILGMSIFPFISKPIMMAGGLFDEEKFKSLMEERKRLIPIWIKATLET
ncbi:TetR family transcriptional regulator [Muricauda sp. 334s03]|uniref:TetR family transcriptional regulator n=2 Tax=Flagellimonas TaxID=444459 RepID=A0ABT5XNG4_9FLAO|nr:MULTISPECIES: TetR family transcriptional regulator [Allomuricauda]MDF0707436.1 TetR family transcriptional regulator [[Muricauda] okinawensis]MDF0715336.1 TetR family transcriptional regulator [[Muricauda] yonaguniensis]